MLDARSPLAVRILGANSNAYQALVVQGETPTLARELLNGVQAEQLVIDGARTGSNASVMLAELWLWHDGLEESHRISQSLDNATGSFWHATMHCALFRLKHCIFSIFCTKLCTKLV